MARNSRLQPGTFELYCGPMFSGKTQEMKLQLHKLSHREDVNYLFFRPRIDTRDKNTRADRLNFNFKETYVNQTKPYDMLHHFDGRYNLVAIDEIMLFGEDITKVIDRFQRERVHVIAAGLDQDFRGEPFGEMGRLLAQADYVKKMSAICMHNGCNDEATRTQRLINEEPAPYDSPVISIEGSKSVETYQCRCIKHHIVPGKPGYSF